MEFSGIEVYREEPQDGDGKTKETKYIKPLSRDFPRFDELARLYDGRRHENIILISETIHEGLYTAGRILNSCLGKAKEKRGSGPVKVTASNGEEVFFDYNASDFDARQKHEVLQNSYKTCKIKKKGVKLLWGDNLWQREKHRKI
ncbi:hypothetical protein FACS18945_1640 [Bacteroidia bacterium]|nr:hypothetical protein FACS18945_1640 [Bacteroidia bacterium]